MTPECPNYLFFVSCQLLWDQHHIPKVKILPLPAPPVLSISGKRERNTSSEHKRLRMSLRIGAHLRCIMQGSDVVHTCFLVHVSSMVK